MNIQIFRVTEAKRFLAGVAILAMVLFSIQGIFAQTAVAATGAVWTTTGSCGDPQNINQYAVGETVFINGSGFTANTSGTWQIKDPGANGTVHYSGPVTTDASGAFCVQARTLTNDDIGGPYNAQAFDKNDNFSVAAATNNSATLRVNKILVNAPQDVTADDFSFTIDGSQTTQFNASGSNSVVLNLADSPFTIVEVEANGNGYTTSYDNCIDVALTSNGATCTVTNTYAPTTGTLVIKKVVVDSNADESEFSFQINGGGSQNFESDGENVILDAATGTYTIVEDPAAGYVTTYANNNNGNTCTDLEVTAGATTTCTITNTLIPPTDIKINVVKNLIQDDGGTEGYSDFEFSYNGGQSYATWGQATATLTLPAGQVYTITENESSVVVSGRYSVTYSDTCNNIDIAAGEEITCIITNDDIAPELTVIKTVINDNGTKTNVAGDFTMNVTGTNVSTASFAGNASGITVTLDAGTYSVDESDDFGYSKSLSDDCSSDVNGAIDLGESRTCTITNDDPAPDRAYITVTKQVINDDGRQLGVSDFPLYVDGQSVTSGQAYEVFSTGNYQVSEDEDQWYTSSFPNEDDSCDENGLISNVVLGQSYTCTIVNDDIPGSSITIDKVVTGEQANNDQSFNFEVTGDITDSFGLSGSGTPKTYSDLQSGTYVFTEGSVPDRWNLDDDVAIECSGAATSSVTTNEASSTVTVDLFAGENITCTFTNEYTPRDSSNDDENIVVRKVVTDGSDTDTQFDFVIERLSDDSTTTFQLAHGMEYDTGDIAAGEWYSISEVNIPEYWSLASTSCVTDRLGQERDIDPSEFQLIERETITCTFTNDQELFEIYGYVWYDDDEDGVWDEGEDPLSNWTVKATNGSKNYQTTSANDGFYNFFVPAGTWTVSETVQNDWAQTFPAGSGTHVVTVPQIPDEEFSFLDSVINFFVPTVFAQTPYPTSYGAYDFGNDYRGGGGGGGTPSPRCDLFTISSNTFEDGDELTLSWETRNGTDVKIEANGVEIYSESNDSIVDEGEFEVTPTEDTEYELTVYRSTRNDTCTIEVTEVGEGGPTPQVLGEQVSAVPLGAAATGAGGASPVQIPSATFAYVAALGAATRVRNGQ